MVQSLKHRALDFGSAHDLGDMALRSAGSLLGDSLSSFSPSGPPRVLSFSQINRSFFFFSSNEQKTLSKHFTHTKTQMIEKHVTRSSLVIREVQNETTVRSPLKPTRRAKLRVWRSRRVARMGLSEADRCVT